MTKTPSLDRLAFMLAMLSAIGPFAIDAYLPAFPQIAATLGVTQSRVSQLRSEAMSLLKDGMNVHLDPELVETPANPAGVAHRRREAYFSAVREHVESVDVAATARAAATALSGTIGAAAQLGAADGVPAARFAALA